jgi:pimeloyl-ACP methyl ester carboxylesterase
MSEVPVGGLGIAYAQAGSGPPLVLLHGGFSDRGDWSQQFEALSDEFTVYAWDTPGCGGSADPPESWRMSDYADCVAGWLAAIDVDRAHLLGLSWGTTLALEVYRRHPDLPASLILAGAYAGWGGSLSPEETSRRLTAVLEDLDLPPEQFAVAYLPSMFTPDAPPEQVAEMTAMMLDVRVTGARPMLHAMAEADLRDVLPTVRVPTLLIYGEHDERAPLDVAREMNRAIPASQLVVIPGVGHCCNAEAADQFNQHVREFLRSLPA